MNVERTSTHVQSQLLHSTLPYFGLNWSLYEQHFHAEMRARKEGREFSRWPDPDKSGLDV